MTIADLSTNKCDLVSVYQSETKGNVASTISMDEIMTLKQFDPKHQSFKSKLKKGDEVVVLTGKSKGETAKIESIDKKRNRVFLEGKNLGKKHTKPDLNNNEGGIIDIPMPLHISNVALADPKGGKATRIGLKTSGDSKQRIAKKSGSVV